MLLLDEIEKAHPDVYNILLQVMDHATLTDNNGRKADFRQVVVIMTSNAGSREMSADRIGFGEDKAVDTGGRTKAAIERVFSPEFRNRLDAIVTFDSLAPGVVETIVEKFVLQLETQLAERRVAITLDDAGGVARLCATPGRGRCGAYAPARRRRRGCAERHPRDDARDEHAY